MKRKLSSYQTVLTLPGEEGRVNQICSRIRALLLLPAISRRLARTGTRTLHLGVLRAQVVHLVHEDVGLGPAAVLVDFSALIGAAVVRGGVVVAVVGAAPGVGGLPPGVEPEVVAVREVDVADVVHLVDGDCEEKKERAEETRRSVGNFGIAEFSKSRLYRHIVFR